MCSSLSHSHLGVAVLTSQNTLINSPEVGDSLGLWLLLLQKLPLVLKLPQELVLPLKLLNVSLSCIDYFHVFAHILQHCSPLFEKRLCINIARSADALSNLLCLWDWECNVLGLIVSLVSVSIRWVLSSAQLSPSNRPIVRHCRFLGTNLVLLRIKSSWLHILLLMLHYLLLNSWHSFPDSWLVTKCRPLCNLSVNSRWPLGHT